MRGDHFEPQCLLVSFKTKKPLFVFGGVSVYASSHYTEFQNSNSIPLCIRVTLHTEADKHAVPVFSAFRQTWVIHLVCCEVFLLLPEKRPI